MKKMLLCLVLLLPALNSFAQEITPVHSSISKAYDGTCGLIRREHLIGAGVLLNNGYIITAAHVVDDNNNNNLEDNEKEVIVYFFNRRTRITCDVVSFGDVAEITSRSVPLDLAILKPRINIRSRVVITSNRPAIGTPIFTIGMLLGEPPSITDGRINFPSSPLIGRASAPIFSGNSGGGIFDRESQEYVGMVVRVAGVAQTIPLSPTTVLRLQQPVFHLSEYVPAFRIKRVLEYVIEKEEQKQRAILLLELFDEILKELEGKKKYY